MIKKRKISAIICVLTIAILTGCVGTKAGAHKYFAENLEKLNGAPFAEAYMHQFGYFKDAQPIEVKHLKNGNKIRVYENIKTPLCIFTGKRSREVCTIYIELDTKTKVIISASAKGDGCYTPY